MIRITLFLIAACALSACANQQNASKSPAPPQPAAPALAVNPACPDLAHWGARQLYGNWIVELPALGQRGTLLLRQCQAQLTKAEQTIRILETEHTPEDAQP